MKGKESLLMDISLLLYKKLVFKTIQDRINYCNEKIHELKEVKKLEPSTYYNFEVRINELKKIQGLLKESV